MQFFSRRSYRCIRTELLYLLECFKWNQRFVQGLGQ